MRTGESSRRPFERVVVAIDASPESLAAADSAARLASRLGTELVGLFVEDRDLLRLSESPLAHLVGRLGTGASGELPCDQVRRQLRVQASRSRAALSRSASVQHVSWSFRVVRGQVTEEILTASSETDVLSFGRFGWSLSREARLGSTASHLLGRRDRPMLVSSRPVETGRTVVIVHDGSGAGTDLLRLAGQLVDERPERLSILVDEAAEQTVRRELGEVLEDGAEKARLAPLPRLSGKAIARHVKQERAEVLLVSAAVAESEIGEVRKLLSEQDCAVLIVV